MAMKEKCNYKLCVHH